MMKKRTATLIPVRKLAIVQKRDLQRNWPQKKKSDKLEQTGRKNEEDTGSSGTQTVEKQERKLTRKETLFGVKTLRVEDSMRVVAKHFVTLNELAVFNTTYNLTIVRVPVECRMVLLHNVYRMWYTHKYDYAINEPNKYRAQGPIPACILGRWLQAKIREEILEKRRIPFSPYFSVILSRSHFTDEDWEK
jgi:hypothetical protein